MAIGASTASVPLQPWGQVLGAEAGETLRELKVSHVNTHQRVQVHGHIASWPATYVHTPPNTE